MNSKSILKIIAGIVLLVAVVGWLVQFLWNNLMTEIFNLPVISIWQAYGLLLLSKILFSGGGTFKNKWKNSCSESMRSKLESMSPEEKERCRQQWEKRCGKWKNEE